MVYETVLDNYGFLWIATDNGISRFDGKRFINYSTKNGLPSNDVIQVFKQNDGTIWANCYKQPPSYFDEKLNRFVCLENDKFVLELSNSLLNVIYPIHKNEMFFQNKVGNFTFSDGKIINKSRTNQSATYIFKNQKFAVKMSDTIFSKEKIFFINFYQNNKKFGSIEIKSGKAPISDYFSNDFIYRFTNNAFTQIKIETLKPFQYKTVTIKDLPNIKWFRFSDSKLSITCTNGNVLIFDEKTLKLRSTIKSSFNVNTAYVDKENNVWVSTLNNGLIYYTTQNIKKEHFSKEVVANFLCAKVDDEGKLLAGNYQGEIYVKNKNEETKHNFSPLKENNLWIRNIHFFPKKTIVVSDNGILINFSKKITFHNEFKKRLNLKSSAKVNDNELILGCIEGLIVFNVKTENYKIVDFNKERILNIKKINDTSFYFSANEGLFKYDLSANKYALVINNQLFKNEKIEHFEVTKSSKIWISTYKGNLFLTDKGRIIKKLRNDKRIPNNISKLLNIDNQLWIASKSGIYILNYADLNKIFISKLTTSDGLTSNVVNFLNFKKDTVYAATDNGISKIPFRNIKIDSEIKPQLIAVKINGITVALNSKYKLKSNQNNISLELAGVDITGHFKNFLYSINDENFTDINGNFLNLQLNSGENKIIIKAINENNEIQKDAINLVFNIEAPFYKTILFWILITLFFSGLIFYFLNRQKLLKQKRKFKQEIELQKQRQKITADLHDDLGATLSSLQINSLIASKLLTTKPDEARTILNQIERQSQKISENIGDIIWSLKPGKDELMTLTTRIKNFANEILGNTNIHFTFDLDESMDTEITDFTMRKNIVLITKEALNNCAKYSKAKNILVKINKVQNAFLLSIFDDGIAFDTETKTGNGMANMQKRAEEINAKFSHFSIAGKNELILNIPIIREEK